MNVKKNYRKIGNKKEIYKDIKTDKDEYVKSKSIYIFFFVKKKKQ